jgi:hypothetical protein
MCSSQRSLRGTVYLQNERIIGRYAALQQWAGWYSVKWVPISVGHSVHRSSESHSFSEHTQNENV